MRPALALLVLLLAGCASPAVAPPAPPAPMLVAIGDSLTMAANVADDSFGDNPGHSWASGGAPRDGIESHYERLVALDAAWANRSLNVAQSGARMSDFARQAQEAVGARGTYVIVLLGGNDACARSTAAMTSVETFAAEFRLGADVLRRGLPPGAIVYVVSIPDAAQLSETLRNSTAARGAWARFHACQSLLSENATEAQRDAFRARVDAYNDVLARESAAFGFATDGGALHRVTLDAADVSTLDYFHPSFAGQERLADATWAASPMAHRSAGEN